MVRIVLVEPEIPQNTGNVARTCVCTGSPLIIAGPMGFTITESRVRRAGLDYWPDLDLTIYDTLEELYQKFPDGNFWYFSSKASRFFTDAEYGREPILVFGKETKGLSPDLLRAHEERCVRFPMVPGARCLNLSNAVCTGLYEVLRQQGFPGLS